MDDDSSGDEDGEEGFVYIMRDKPNRVKVGCSNDPMRRQRQLQTGNVDVELFHWFPPSEPFLKKYEAEKMAHRALQATPGLLCIVRFGRFTEWFEPSDCDCEDFLNMVRGIVGQTIEKEPVGTSRKGVSIQTKNKMIYLSS